MARRLRSAGFALEAVTTAALSVAPALADLPDMACAACGTMSPGGERICPICARKPAAAKGAGWTMLRHWLFTIAVLTVLYGGAYLLTP
ncbi:hypothetical protein [Rhodovulum sp.]|uniref:hypothetical protein n=1 Tax=Rhodovulum sp. TaxID=34009 RepID=UPI00257BF434|nr:hypothetical protein [Rhodovulum sp.]